MDSRRFRLLERSPEASEAAPAVPEPAPELEMAARARSLERPGELTLDESRSVATHFCRACHFENKAELARCLNCATPLGGAGQEAFDEEIRARHAARHPLHDGAEARLHPTPRSATPATESPSEPTAKDEPGMGAVLAAGLLTSSIFALVSMPVRFIFSRAFGGSFSWHSCGELLLVIALSAVVYAVYGRQLRRF